MFILTKYPGKYSEAFKKEHEVVDWLTLYHDSGRVAAEQGQHDFRELEGTAGGPCLILGMGSSRKLIEGKRSGVPLFAINRAILDHPCARYWCAHDLESLVDCIDKVSPETTIVTYATHFRKEGWEKIKERGNPVYFIEIFPDPRRHKKRPLFWNQSTFGWTLDLAIRIGHNPVYVLGIDKSLNAYHNPHFTPEQMMGQHARVQERIAEMWQGAGSIGAWNSRNARVLDLADNGYIPVEKGDINAVLS